MDKNRQSELIKKLASILEELEWMVAIPTDENVCRGLIVGEADFVIEVTKSHYGEDAEIVIPNNDSALDREKEHDVNIELNPNKKTIH